MRRSFILLAILLFVISPEALFGQLGGLRRRAQEAVTPRQEPRKAVQPIPVTITDDVITRYLRGLAARERAMREKARENNDIGRYFAAVIRRDSLQRRQNDYRAETGPDFERAKQYRDAMNQGDASAAQKLQELETSFDPNKVTLPEADWNAQREGNFELDSLAMVGAGGFSAGQWAYIIDQIPPIVGSMSHNGATTDSLVNGIVEGKKEITAAEVIAVRARREELTRALIMNFRSNAMIARAAAEEEENERRRREAEAGPDPKTYNGCLTIEMKAVTDEMGRRQAEIDEAAKRNDVARLAEISNQLAVLQQKATQKCAPLLNQ